MSIIKLDNTIIYQAKATCTKDEKTYIYIGKTKKNLDERRKQHEGDVKNNKPASFQQALRKIPSKEWEWKVLFRCDAAIAHNEEKRIIDQLRRHEKNDANIVILNDTEKDSPIKTVTLKVDYGIPRANKQKNYSLGKMGEMFARASGKLKPVKNLKTNQIYKSTLEAERKDKVPRIRIKNSCDTGRMLSDGTRYAYIDLDDQPILTEGHNQDRYIGKNAKKIKELISGRIFNSTAEAAQEYGLSDSTIGGNAIGIYSIIKDKFVFCYLNEDGSEKRTSKHDSAIEKIKKMNQYKYVAWPVDFTFAEAFEKHEVGYFATVGKLCEDLGIKNKSHIKAVCDGIRSHAETYRISYYDHETGEPQLTEKHKIKSRKIIRRIQCLNDKQIFNNCTEAGTRFKVAPNQIGMCARGILKSVRGVNQEGTKKRLRFAYVDVSDRPIKTPKHEEPLLPGLTQLREVLSWS